MGGKSVPLSICDNEMLLFIITH